MNITSWVGNQVKQKIRHTHISIKHVRTTNQWPPDLTGRIGPHTSTVRLIIGSYKPHFPSGLDHGQRPFIINPSNVYQTQNHPSKHIYKIPIITQTGSKSYTNHQLIKVNHKLSKFRELACIPKADAYNTPTSKSTSIQSHLQSTSTMKISEWPLSLKIRFSCKNCAKSNLR